MSTKRKGMIMKEIKDLRKILVCLDLTNIDHALIRYASFLSQALDIYKITFLHAIQAYDLPDTGKFFPDLQTSLSKTIEEEINSVVSHHFKKKIKTEVITKIEDEDISDVIIRFIEKEHIDLTLVGQKYGEDREGHYGKQIAGQSASDVMFIPEDTDFAINKIICAVDFSKASEKAFKRALDLAKATSAELICYYIYDTTKSYFPGTTLKTFTTLEKQFHKKYRKYLQRFDLQPGTIPCRSQIGEELNNQAYACYNAAVKEGAELLIVGAKGKTNVVTSLLGNIAENLRRMDKETVVMIIKNAKRNKKHSFF